MVWWTTECELRYLKKPYYIFRCREGGLVGSFLFAMTEDEDETLHEIFAQEDKEWKEKMGMASDPALLRALHEQHPMRTEAPINEKAQVQLNERLAAAQAGMSKARAKANAQQSGKSPKTKTQEYRLLAAQRGLEAKKMGQARAKASARVRHQLGSASESAPPAPGLSLGARKKILLKIGARHLASDDELLGSRRRQLIDTRARTAMSCMLINRDGNTSSTSSGTLSLTATKAPWVARGKK
jgi:hypothetical protein